MRDIFHQAVGHFEAGRWAQAMNLLYSKDSALDVLVGLENEYEANANSLTPSTSLLDDGYDLGTARMLRADFAMQLAMCKGAQLIHTGDLHFSEAEAGEPEDLLARALLAQDDYRYVDLSCCDRKAM